MERNQPAPPRKPRKFARAATLGALAASCALGLLAARSNVFAGSNDPAGPNPVTLGEKIFADASLSASGAMSCATCHDPKHAHAQSNDLSVQLGGPNLDVPGFRAVPSLQYISFMPSFSFASDGTPTGGFNRDGRANDLMVQALRPLFAAHEMANATPADSQLGQVETAARCEEFQDSPARSASGA